MKLAFIVLGLASLLTMGLYLRPWWRWRRQFSLAIGMVWIIFAIVTISLLRNAWSALTCILAGYQLITVGRIYNGRIQADYLYHASLASSLWLVSAQTVVLTAAALTPQLHWHGDTYVFILAGAQLGIVVVLLGSTVRNLKTTRLPAVPSLASRDLPSLTVAIPARNETSDLEECLQSLIASNYPKLEILVLDDCSQDKRTPEIIRGYAHDGVRFIAGDMPPAPWLAKNYAYRQLAEQANGELLLFCGVDTRFAVHSLKRMVEVMLYKQKTMVSLIPQNMQPPLSDIEPMLVQPGRYAWEMSLPRRWFDRPPVLSTCWLIDKATLEDQGGFAAVRHTPLPERYLARQTALHGDGYSFIRSNQTIGLSSQKSPAEQRATAIRVRYPSLHRRPELVCLVSLLELGGLVLPFVMFVGCLAIGWWPLAALTGSAFLLDAICYTLITWCTYQRFLARSLCLMPFAALYDIGLLNYSMWRYEFREVIWKDRNICLPVMRAIAKLPSLDKPN